MTVVPFEAINGEEILDEVSAFLRRFVSYPSPHAHAAHVLWIAHTHLMDVWDTTPRLAALSPEPASGKSRLLEVTALLVPRPVETISATPPYLFRRVSDPTGRPTIIYDEIDTVFGPKAQGRTYFLASDAGVLRGLFLAGAYVQARLRFAATSRATQHAISCGVLTPC